MSFKLRGITELSRISHTSLNAPVASEQIMARCEEIETAMQAREFNIISAKADSICHLYEEIYRAIDPEFIKDLQGKYAMEFSVGVRGLSVKVDSISRRLIRSIQAESDMSILDTLSKAGCKLWPVSCYFKFYSDYSLIKTEIISAFGQKAKKASRFYDVVNLIWWYASSAETYLLSDVSDKTNAVFLAINRSSLPLSRQSF